MKLNLTRASPSLMEGVTLNFFCYAIPVLFSQWTEAGVDGRHGPCARDRVALEYKQEYGLATIHDQHTEASSVPARAERHVLVTLMIAQVLTSFCTLASHKAR